MRTLFFSITLFLLVSLGSCRYHHHQDNLKITVSETGDKYTFYAMFPEDKTNRVHRAFNRSIEPNGLFKSADDYMNVTTSLQDNTNFAVKASPGMIEITVKRDGNSPASYNRVKDICANVKEALKD